jgi:hypothetical protein
MLKPNEFIDRDKSIMRFIDIVDSQLKKQNASFEKDIDDEKRRTWYLDTTQNTLYKNYNFLFRIRPEYRKDGSLKEYDLTLKCRHPDRYISASYDLSSPTQELKETKFEEDITSPLHSKFSLSAKFEEKQEPQLNTFQELVSIFPALKSLGIPVSETLKKVNEFEATEVSYKIGKIIFADGNKVKTEINFWYLSDEEKTPMIVELTFDYQGKATDVLSDKILLEQWPQSVFPLTLIENVNEFYSSLQKNSIADLDTSAKTKTEYAYQYRQ